MLRLRDLTAVFACLTILIVRSSRGSEIINGNEVVPHSLPYMALVVSSKPKCGGTLISPSWVLTAAHCKNVKQVWLGVHSIKARETKTRQTRKVQKSVTHPHYDATSKVNDLQLLKLDKPVIETSAVKPLKLKNTIKDPAEGTPCMVAGWGQISTTIKKMSNILMAVNVTVVSRQTCNSREYYNNNPVITSDMICAGSNGKRVADTCSGDSGGPLICSGNLVGVTSFGYKCGLIKKPGVYVYLSSKKVDWIQMTMKS